MGFVTNHSIYEISELMNFAKNILLDIKHCIRACKSYRKYINSCFILNVNMDLLTLDLCLIRRCIAGYKFCFIIDSLSVYLYLCMCT